jgi:ABC-type uncharacterized transport system substrate-binding protein
LGFDDEAVLVLLGKLSRGADDLIDKPRQIHGLGIEFKLAGFDLREVQYLVDEAKQVRPGRATGPDGNITGFASQNVNLEVKRLEILRDLLPHLSRVGILANVSNPVLTATLQQLRSVAEALRVTIDVFEVRSSGDLQEALARLQEARPDGALVAPDLLLLSNRADIAEALAKGRLPAVYPFREYAGVGGLVIHGANLSVLFERAAGYVDRILKGTKPSDLPVQLATEFELIINLRTAARIGPTIPPTLIARADEVIE